MHDVFLIVKYFGKERTRLECHSRPDGDSERRSHRGRLSSRGHASPGLCHLHAECSAHLTAWAALSVSAAHTLLCCICVLLRWQTEAASQRPLQRPRALGPPSLPNYNLRATLNAAQDVSIETKRGTERIFVTFIIT